MTLPKIGCCGFQINKTKYAEKFSVVEVQQTFYQPPQLKTLERWRTEVSPDFEFTLKAWQLITHSSNIPTYRRLKEKLTASQLKECGSFQATEMVERAWEKTLACAQALAARYILFQCPASFTPTPKNLGQMRQFFAGLRREDFNLLWEPRGNWPDDLVRGLCQELELIHTVDPFLLPPPIQKITYLRLHGGKGFRHVFTDAELLWLAGLVDQRENTYVMFNNISMLSDAERFKKSVENKYAA